MGALDKILGIDSSAGVSNLFYGSGIQPQTAQEAASNRTRMTAPPTVQPTQPIQPPKKKKNWFDIASQAAEGALGYGYQATVGSAARLTNLLPGDQTQNTIYKAIQRPINNKGFEAGQKTANAVGQSVLNNAGGVAANVGGFVDWAAQKLDKKLTGGSNVKDINTFRNVAQYFDKSFGTDTVAQWEDAQKRPALAGINTALMLASGGGSKFAQMGTQVWFGGQLLAQTPQVINVLKNEPDKYKKIEAGSGFLMGLALIAHGTKDAYNYEKPVRPEATGFKTEKTVAKTAEFNKSDIVDFVSNRNERFTPEQTDALTQAFTENPNLAKDIRKGNLKYKYEVTTPTMYGKLLNAIRGKMGKGENLTPAEQYVAADFNAHPEIYLPAEKVNPSDLVRTEPKPIINKPAINPEASTLVQATPVTPSTNPSDLVNIDQPAQPVQPVQPEEPSVQPFGRLEVTPKNPTSQQIADKLWEDKYSEKAGQLDNQQTRLQNSLKEAKAADRLAIREQLDTVNKQAAKLENDFLKEAKGYVEQKKSTVKPVKTTGKLPSELSKVRAVSKQKNLETIRTISSDYATQLKDMVGGVSKRAIEQNYGNDKYIRESANPEWYKSFYAEHKRAPNKQELIDIAHGQILDGSKEAHTILGSEGIHAYQAAYDKVYKPKANKNIVTSVDEINLEDIPFQRKSPVESPGVISQKYIEETKMPTDLIDIQKHFHNIMGKNAATAFRYMDSLLKNNPGTMAYTFKGAINFLDETTPHTVDHEQAHHLEMLFMKPEERAAISEYLASVRDEKIDRAIRNYAKEEDVSIEAATKAIELERHADFIAETMQQYGKGYKQSIPQRILGIFRRFMERLRAFFGDSNRSGAKMAVDTALTNAKARENTFLPREKWTRTIAQLEQRAGKSFNPSKQVTSEFKGLSELSTKVVEQLKGKEIVSKEYIKNLSNAPDVKQTEREVIAKALEDLPPGRVGVKEFANAVKTELLPLTSKEVGSVTAHGTNVDAKYDGITLPSNLRGDVKQYSERVYESPIKTEAGDIHFSSSEAPNYFAHTRLEDMSGNLRRVIEIQSDLFQKGRLDEDLNRFMSPVSEEYAKKNWDVDEIYAISDKGREYLIQDSTDLKEALGWGRQFVVNRGAKNTSFAKLDAYKNTWHERIIREEIKSAAQEGKTILQIPTGETAMKIEGLSSREDKWVTLNNEPVNGTNIKVGDLITYQTHEGTPHEYRRFLITKNNGDGTFSAVDNMTAENDWGFHNFLEKKNLLDDGREPTLEELHSVGGIDKELIGYLDHLSEQLSNNDTTDTSNPIYKFYEKDIQKFLKRIRPDLQTVTDTNGVTWYQTKLSEADAQAPVVAFQRKSKEQKQTPLEEAEAVFVEHKAKHPIESTKEFASKINTAINSRFNPLTKLEKKVTGGNDVIPLGKKFELLAGATGLGEADVHDFANAVVKPIRKDSADFETYLFLQRTISRLKVDPEARAVGNWTIDKATQALDELKNKNSTKYELYQKQAEVYQTEMDKSLRTLVDSGLMSEEVYKTIKDSNDFYARFKVMKWYDQQNGGLPGTGANISLTSNGVKRIIGIHDEDVRIGSILQASAEQIYMNRMRAEKNLKMQVLARLADTENELITHTQPTRYYMVNYNSGEEILQQLSMQKQPLEQSFIKVGRAIELADELGIPINKKRMMNLGRATLGGIDNGGKIDLNAFTSETVAHEFGHIFDTKTGEYGMAFGREYEKRLSSMVGGKGMRNEMKAIINYRKADAPESWKSKGVEKFAEFVSLYIHNPAKARELAPTFTDKFETDILPNAKIKQLIEHLAEFYQKVDKRPNIMTPLKKLDNNNYLELAIRRAFPETEPVMAVSFAKKTKPGYDQITYFADGKLKALEVPNEISDVIKSLNATQLGIWARALSLGKRPFRAGVTTFNFAFNLVKNPIFSDIPRLALISKYGLRNPTDLVRFPLDITHAFFSSLGGNFGGKNKLYEQFLRSGVTASTFQREITPQAFKPTLGIKEKGVIKKVVKTPGKALDTMAKFSSVMEEMTKIAGLKRAFRFEGKKLKDLSSKVDEAKAAYEKAVEIKDEEAITATGKALSEAGHNLQDLLDSITYEIRNFSGSPDFSKHGKYTKDINLVLMFFSAHLNEVTADLGRLSGKQGGAKQAAASWAKLGILLGIPALLLAAKNNQDQDHKDDYAKLPAWEKDNYFMIPTNNVYNNQDGQRVREYYRVPKRGITQIVGNIVEGAANFAINHDKESVMAFIDNLQNDVTPVNTQGQTIKEKVESMISSLNPLIKAPIEFATGRSTFQHSDTIPQRMKDASPQLQYKDSTPSIYKAIGAMTGNSPLILQQIAETFGASALTQFARQAPEPGKDAKSQYPILKTFYSSGQIQDDKLQKALKMAIRQQADERLTNKRQETGSSSSSLSYDQSLFNQLNKDQRSAVMAAATPEQQRVLQAGVDSMKQAQKTSRRSRGRRTAGRTVRRVGTRRVSTRTRGVRKLGKTKTIRVKPIRVKKVKVRKLKV